MPDSRAIGDIPNENNTAVNSGKNYLLAIGIDKYADPNIRNLNSAVSDVEKISKVLVDKFGFEDRKEFLIFDEEATKQNINDAFKRLKQIFDDNPIQDNLIVYLACHGDYDKGFRIGYRLPTEAKKNHDSTYIEDSAILDRLKGLKSKHILLISDSCFSGSLVRSVETEGYIFEKRSEELPSRHILTSGLLEFVDDGYRDDNSPFAKAILYFLQTENRALIPFSDVAQFVKKTVPKNSKQKQIPHYGELNNAGDDFLGEFVLRTIITDVVKQAYDFAKTNPTIHNLNQFLDDFPKSIYEEEIETLLEEVEQREAFEAVKRVRTTSACRNFLKKFPQGIYADKVNAIKEEILSKENIERENRESERIERDKQERERLAKLELEKQEKARLEKLEQDKQELKRLEILEAERKGRELLEKLEREKQERERLAKIEKEKLSKKFDFEPKMVLIKGGTFEMGDVMGDNEYDHEKPVHKVTLDSFNLGIYPVTQAQWQAVMGNNPSSFKGENLPVENVSWDDAQEFLKKLNEQTGKQYRLPTEAEWEYAAREGGKKVRFGNGKDIANPTEINFDGSKDYKKSYSLVGKYRGKTTPVGSFSPNSLGLFDMSGNVWEWCSDWFGAYSANETTNPKGASSGSYRVLRGGGWYDTSSDCRMAYRYYYAPTNRRYDLGFRVASPLQ